MKTIDLVSIMIAMFVLVSNASSNSSGCTPTSREYLIPKTYGHRVDWSYEHYERFSELSIACDMATLFANMTLYTVTFQPRLGSIVTEQQDLRSLANPSGSLRFFYTNIGGFDIGLRGPIFLYDPNMTLTLLFDDLTFSFYFLNDAGRLQLLDEEHCRTELERGGRPMRLFADSPLLSVTLGVSVSLPTPVCPLVFRDASVKSLSIRSYQHNLMSHHGLTFYPLRDAATLDLNARVEELTVRGIYHSRIDALFLNELVFKRTVSILLQGFISSIDEATFAPLVALRQLTVSTFNSRQFYHASDNKWLANLFKLGPQFASQSEKASSKLNAEEVFLLVLDDWSRRYMFPAEDFCLFKHFPAERAVVAHLRVGSMDQSIDGCLAAFLTQNQAVFHMIQHHYENDPAPSTKNCDFSQKLEICNAATLKSAAVFGYFYPEDRNYLFDWLELVGPITTLPFVSFVGFVTNLLIILTIRHKPNQKEKLFDSRFFDYIYYNSVLNCCECFISSFRLIDECMSVDGAFCSQIRESLVSMYFSVVFIGYTSELLKTASILTGLFFSLERYIECSDAGEHRLLRALGKLNTRRTFMCILAASALLSATKFFEYDLEQPAEMVYDRPNFFAINVYKYERAQSPTEKLEIYLYFAHYVLNDLVFLALNLLVDMLLVRSIKRDLHKKALAKESLWASATSHTRTEKKKRKSEISMQRRAESRANKMIVFSLVLYVVCRLPELVVQILFYLPRLFGMASLCSLQRECYFLANLIQYLYMYSYSTTIVFYVKFNKNFKLGFKNFLTHFIGRLLCW